MRVLKWIGIVLGVVVLIALVTGGVLYFMGGRALASTTTAAPTRTITVPTDAAAIARGEHLVHHVNLCTDCHGDNLQGTVFVNDPQLGVIPAPNLTSGQGGINGPEMTDAKWVNAITGGIGHDGRKLVIMPVTHYHIMNDADLGAVIAYVKQVPPQDNEMAPRKGGPLGRVLLAVGALRFESDIAATLPAPVDIAPAANAEYGAYMLEIAGCRGCHGDNLAGATDPNAPQAPNITTALLGTWSEDQFVNLIRTGTLPTGGSVSDEMPWKKYAGMEDVELKAIYAYLQTTQPLPNNP